MCFAAWSESWQRKDARSAVATGRGCSKMGTDSVEIEKLSLRIPGLSREEGRGIGEEVVERVARDLPANGRRQHLGALDLRVNVPVGTPPDQMAKLIALAILEKLG